MKQTKVLVTGATGFLGKRLVKRLVEEGYPVRALARKQSNVDALNELAVEIAIGDLGDESSVVAAVNGADVVLHAGAATWGTAKQFDAASIQGTRNVLEACRTRRVKKLVYISSCSVYEVAGFTANQVVTEEAQLERFPDRRGHYSAAKLRAEALVTEAMKLDGYSTVVLRPGVLYGYRSEVFTKMMGISILQRVFIVFGKGESELPLAHVDNTVDSIVECIRNSAADNQVFNVVDQDPVTKKMYMERVVEKLYPKAIVIYFPMSLLLILTWLQEKLIGILGKQPFLTTYRLLSSQKPVRYDTSSIRNAIGWRSRINFEEGAEQLVREHGEASDSESR